MINIPIGPQSFSQDFLDGQGHFNFDLPGGLRAGDPFSPTVTEVLNTGASVEKSDLTFGDPDGVAMSASIGGGGATKVELIWPGAASEFATAYGLSVAPGRVGARFHLEGQASVKVGATVPIPAALSNFAFGLSAGSHVHYDRYCDYDATMTSIALLQDVLSGITLPQGSGSPQSLPRAGELRVFGYDGFLALTAGVTSGYDLLGHRDVTLNDLDTVIEYGLRLKSAVSVGYKIGGSFEIASRLGAGSTWVRLTVKKKRSSQFDFAAAFQADAIAAVTGLPGSADEFLSSLFGADTRRVLEIFQKIRTDSDLDALQADVDRLLIGSVTNLANRWLGRALDRANVKEFQTAAGKVVDAYRAADPDWLNAAVHLYEDYVDRQDIPGLVAALQKVVALNSRDDLATLDDQEAWSVITRLAGGGPEALLADDGTFDEVRAIAQTGLDFSQGGLQPQLRDVVDELKARVKLGPLFDRLMKFTTREGLLGLTDTALQGVAERLLGIAWDKIKQSDLAKAAAELKAALDQVNDFKDAWYGKLADALHQSFSFSANAAYTRASSNDALIDIEIDVSTPQGRRLFTDAAHGQFAKVFDRPNLEVLRVHQGVMTHGLKKSAQLQIHVLQWQASRIVDVMSQTTNSVEVHATGLVNVFTTEASIKERLAHNGYSLESRFLVNLAGQASSTPRRTKDTDYLVRTLEQLGVTYNLAVSDSVTTAAELTQYLELAEYLQLIPSAADMATELSTQFPNGLGNVTAAYVAKYDSKALSAAFGRLSNAPLREVVRQASRRLVSAHLISSSNPKSDLVTLGFAYRDPAHAAAYDRDGFAAFRNENSTVILPAWFTKGAPREAGLASGSFVRIQLTALYAIEAALADGLAGLDNVIDRARSKGTAVAESDLENASREFVSHSAEIDDYGTINTFFCIFDAFVERGGGARPTSTLILQITPAGSQAAVTKYLMRGSRG